MSFQNKILNMTVSARRAAPYVLGHMEAKNAAAEIAAEADKQIADLVIDNTELREQVKTLTGLYRDLHENWVTHAHILERVRSRIESWRRKADAKHNDAFNDCAADLAAALNAPVSDPLITAASDVLAERRRQVEVEGWTPEHDDQHNDGQMAGAAICYALASVWPQAFTKDRFPPFWPWDKSWWKPTDQRRNLVKAGALILAEIERLDQAQQRAQLSGDSDQLDIEEQIGREGE